MNLSVYCMVNVLTLQQSMHITLPSSSTDIKDAAARLLLTSKERQDFWYRKPISALGFSPVAEYKTELSAVLRYVHWDTDSISDPREKVIDGQFSAWCNKTERRGGLPIRSQCDIRTIWKLLLPPPMRLCSQLCPFVGWFDCRIVQKLLNRFTWDLNGGWITARNSTH